jgi:hypothetical protein
MVVLYLQKFENDSFKGEINMNEKFLKSRIVHKHDVEANWKLAAGFTPLAGEIIVYDVDENYSYERFKIGDGVTNVNNLPFCYSAITNDEIDDICTYTIATFLDSICAEEVGF